VAHALARAVRSPQYQELASSIGTVSVQIQGAEGAASMDASSHDTGPAPDTLRRPAAPSPKAKTGPARAEERKHARELARARAAFAACVAELPETLRAAAVGDDEDGPSLGRTWPLARVEECAERLANLDPRRLEPRAARLVREARREKAAIDAARSALVLANLGLVAHVARQFAVRGLSFGDLVQEGTLGLLTAVERFEVDRGYKFSTYAYWWVRQSISNAVAAESTFLRLPDYARATLRRYRNAARESEAMGGEDFLSVARRVGVASHRLSQLIAAARQPFSLERTVIEDEEELLRQMPDHRTPSPLHRALDREMRERISDAVGRLDTRERTILLHRFAVDAERRCTLAQLGRMLDLTRERVRQIEQQALAKILRAGAGTAMSARMLRRFLTGGSRGSRASDPLVRLSAGHDLQ
jgi:RNA polymerase sigma factor (sigma-70 family)